MTGDRSVPVRPDDGSIWRFYFHQGTDSDRGDACILAIRIWRGMCGYSFVADRIGISPPIWFGRSVPRCVGVKPYIITSDADNARMWFDVIRTSFVRHGMGDMGFADDQSALGSRAVREVAVLGDGCYAVDVRRESHFQGEVQAVWTVGPTMLRCSYRYPEHGDNLIVPDPSLPCMSPMESWGVLADTLSTFFENMLSKVMSLPLPEGVGE